MDTGFIFFALFINFILSLVVARFAENKGLRFAPYFWLSFLLSWVIGIIFVAAAPSQAPVPTPVEEGILVICPHCAEKIRAEANVCKHCGRDVEPRLDLIEEAELREAERIEAKRVAGLRYLRSNRITNSVIQLVFVLPLFLFAGALIFSGNIVATFIAMVVGAFSALLAILGIRGLSTLPPKV